MREAKRHTFMIARWCYQLSEKYELVNFAKNFEWKKYESQICRDFIK